MNDFTPYFEHQFISTSTLSEAQAETNTLSAKGWQFVSLAEMGIGFVVVMRKKVHTKKEGIFVKDSNGTIAINYNLRAIGGGD